MGRGIGEQTDNSHALNRRGRGTRLNEVSFDVSLNEAVSLMNQDTKPFIELARSLKVLDENQQYKLREAFLLFSATANFKNEVFDIALANAVDGTYQNFLENIETQFAKVLRSAYFKTGVDDFDLSERIKSYDQNPKVFFSPYLHIIFQETMQRMPSHRIIREFGIHTRQGLAQKAAEEVLNSRVSAPIVPAQRTKTIEAVAANPHRVFDSLRTRTINHLVDLSQPLDRTLIPLFQKYAFLRFHLEERYNSMKVHQSPFKFSIERLTGKPIDADFEQVWLDIIEDSKNDIFHNKGSETTLQKNLTDEVFKRLQSVNLTEETIEELYVKLRSSLQKINSQNMSSTEQFIRNTDFAAFQKVVSKKGQVSSLMTEDEFDEIKRNAVENSLRAFNSTILRSGIQTNISEWLELIAENSFDEWSKTNIPPN